MRSTRKGPHDAAQTGFTVILGVLAAGAAAAGTLAPGLEAQLQTAQEHELIKCLVVLKGQPDVVGLDKSMVGQGIARKERHRVVVQSLQDAATSSQRDLVAALTADKAAGQIAGFVPHWIINGIVLTATPARIREIALRDDVERIEPDLVPELIKPVEIKVVEGSPADKGFVTPGLVAINAPRVWHELGINGAGTIIAGLDSGVDVTHPALGPRWRGHVAPASECWFNPTGSGSLTAPFDGYGHGTHTMGTMTGASPSDTVGVAPGARWIATNAIATGIEPGQPGDPGLRVAGRSRRQPQHQRRRAGRGAEQLGRARRRRLPRLRHPLVRRDRQLRGGRRGHHLVRRQRGPRPVVPAQPAEPGLDPHQQLLGGLDADHLSLPDQRLLLAGPVPVRRTVRHQAGGHGPGPGHPQHLPRRRLRLHERHLHGRAPRGRRGGADAPGQARPGRGHHQADPDGDQPRPGRCRARTTTTATASSTPTPRC